MEIEKSKRTNGEMICKGSRDQVHGALVSSLVMLTGGPLGVIVGVKTYENNNIIIWMVYEALLLVSFFYGIGLLKHCLRIIYILEFSGNELIGTRYPERKVRKPLAGIVGMRRDKRYRDIIYEFDDGTEWQVAATVGFCGYAADRIMLERWGEIRLEDERLQKLRKDSFLWSYERDNQFPDEYEEEELKAVEKDAERQLQVLKEMGQEPWK